MFKSTASHYLCITTCGLSFVFGFAGHQDCFAQGRTENPLAETQLPTGTGGEFSTFMGVKLNNQGQVVFYSDLQNVPDGLGTKGIYRWQEGAIIELVRSLQEIPDGNGDIFTGDCFSQFGYADSGSVSFQDQIGIFRAETNGIVCIAQMFQSTPDGGLILDFPCDAEGTSINSAGQVAFAAITSQSLLDEPDTFRGDGTSLSQLSSDGIFDFPIPDNPFFTCGSRGININAFGEVLFVNCRTYDIIFPFPDFVSSEFLTLDNVILTNSAVGVDEILQSDLNDLGQVVFSAVDNFETILNSSGVIVSGSTPSPDGQGDFDFPHDPTINNAGDVAFQSDMSNGTPPGLFRTLAGQLQVVVRSGDPRPGGGVFDVSAAQPILNKFGTIAFQDGNGGIYLADDQELIEVVELGEFIFVQGTINNLQISTNSAEGTSLNDMGQMTYIAQTEVGQFVMRFTPDVRFRSTTDGSWDECGNWTLGLAPGIVHEVHINPEVDLTVSGPSQNVSIRSLQVGGGSGTATLLLGGGTINPVGTNIDPNGILSGNGHITGITSMAGEINSGNLIFDDIFMLGSINGDSDLTITGSMINAAPLLFNGDTNIDVNGQLINFAGFGIIQFDDGVVRAGSLINEADILVTSGTNHIFGSLTNVETGLINVSPGSNLTFSEDLIQNGTLVLENDGTHLATAVAFGDFTGAGGFTGGGNLFVIGDLDPGNSPASVTLDGNLFLGSGTDTIIELAGTTIGEFDQLIITGDTSLDGNLSVQILTGFQLETGQEFLIAETGGEVDGQFIGMDEGDLIGNFGGVDLFITYAGGDGNDVVLFSDEEVLLGDVNLDGVVNLLDVDPFIDRLSTGMFQAEADCNQDGVVNLLDVNPFILLLSGG